MKFDFYYQIAIKWKLLNLPQHRAVTGGWYDKQRDFKKCSISVFFLKLTQTKLKESKKIKTH